MIFSRLRKGTFCVLNCFREAPHKDFRTKLKIAYSINTKETLFFAKKLQSDFLCPLILESRLVSPFVLGLFLSKEH